MSMIIPFILYFSSSTSNIDKSAIFCVCPKPTSGNCVTLCQGNPILGVTDKSIETSLTKSNAKEILFIVAGTKNNDTNYQPDFNLTAFRGRSIHISSVNPKIRETINLFPGHVNTDIRHSFSNLNVVFSLSGVYDFYELKLRNTALIYGTKKLVELEQDILNTDFQSLHDISKSIDFTGPTSGVRVVCNETVNRVEFLPTHYIFFHTINNDEAFLDFSQMDSHTPNATISMMCRRLTMSFSHPPTDLDFFPIITFQFLKTTNIFIDEEQFADEVMDLTEKITLKHGLRALYVDSRNGTIAPTFKYDGSGIVLANKEKVVYKTSYCLCEGENCQNYCGGEVPVSFANIDRTVIGNPNHVLKYVIGGTKADGPKPIFDLDHFGDRNLTVYGHTNNEHIIVQENATDDIGFHKYSSIVIHTKDNFLFPNVALYNVDFEFEGKGKGVITSVHLEIDFTTLQNSNTKKLQIIAPLNGLEVHATNILKGDVPINILDPTVVSIDKLNLSVRLHTCIEIYCGGSVSLMIDPNFPKKLSKIPKIILNLEGDTNSINFVGKWDQEFQDMTAKVTVSHGINPLYIQGDYDGTQYKFDPPIIAQDGTGPLFYNGVLLNFKSKYCVCEGTLCPEKCVDLPIVNFSEDAIALTAFRNPTRCIEYVVYSTSSTRRPFFGLHLFEDRSFLITSGKGHGHITIEGTSNPFSEVTTSVSHIFRDLNIKLINQAIYVFNNADFLKCDFEKNSTDGRYFVHQHGMTSDLYSLSALSKIGLLSPCSLYLTVNGDHTLTKIRVDDTNLVTLFGHDCEEGVQIDLSGLKHSVATFISHLGDTEEGAIRVIWGIKDSFFSRKEMPHFTIDVSGTDGNDAFVQFEGRKWNEDYHNLTEKITVVHGQVDIHIITPPNDGHYSGQPPHVTLIGDADYYINDVRQVSVFAPGNHEFSEDDEDKKGQKIRWILLTIIVLAVGIAFYVFIHTPRGDVEMPKMRIAPQHDIEEDDQLANFLNTEDDDNSA